MLTSPETAVVRPAYHPFSARVARIATLTPSFVRVTFVGDDLGGFGTEGLDQRIKLVFPTGNGDFADIGTGTDWYARWRNLPDDERNPIRTYTARAVRPDTGELDVDFVVHGDGGPAARWLARATIGDELVIVGPDARSDVRSNGIDWRPGTATELLIAGDETAAPAICSIIETLPAGSRAAVFIEVPTAADVFDIRSDAAVDITWIARDSAAYRLDSAVRAWVGSNRDLLRSALAHEPQTLEDIDVDIELLWDSPAPASVEFYSWIAGESAVIKGIRRMLVSETGVDRSRVAFMGYWRHGKAEGN